MTGAYGVTSRFRSPETVVGANDFFGLGVIGMYVWLFFQLRKEG